jgi:hypothetical protein
MRGFQLVKQKDILTTSELIEEAVIKWQLNMTITEINVF